MVKRVLAFVILAVWLVALTLILVAGELSLSPAATPFWLITCALSGWTLVQAIEALFSEWES